MSVHAWPSKRVLMYVNIRVTLGSYTYKEASSNDAGIILYT